MKWFKHDSYAHTDVKHKKVRHKYGLLGYGLYWYCVELIAAKVERNNVSFMLEEGAEDIAIDWNADEEKVKEILGYFVEIGLLECENDRYTCLRLAKRLDDSNSKHPQIKEIRRKLDSAGESPINSEKLGESPINSEKLGESPINSEKLGESPSRLDKTRLDKTRLDKTRLDKTRQEEIRQEEIKKTKDKTPKQNTFPALQEPLSSSHSTSTSHSKAEPIFDYWVFVMGKNKSTTKLTPKRKKNILARLKDGYSADYIKQAIDGCRTDPFSMGQNKRNKPFNDIELICRTGEKLEGFKELTEALTVMPQKQDFKEVQKQAKIDERNREFRINENNQQPFIEGEVIRDE